jgi:uncharacterized protein involved in exopolysaccharide biosynthesis
MKRLLHLAARVYPAAWRKRYGAELDSLLDDVRPGYAAVWDVLKEGTKMQVKRSRVAAAAAAFGVTGALAGGAVAFTTPDRFESSARIRLSPPTAEATGRLDVPALLSTAFSRANLAGIIERQDLYREERSRGHRPLDDAAERMRGDIRVQLQSGSGVVRVSFQHGDPARAQRVAQDLVGQLSQSEGGSLIRVIDPPDRPRAPCGPNRLSITGFGLAVGALLGAIGALTLRTAPRPAH